MNAPNKPHTMRRITFCWTPQVMLCITFSPGVMPSMTYKSLPLQRMPGDLP